MKIIIAIAFVLIFASLGSALFYLLKDKGNRKRTVYALMLRVGLSITLFIFILFSYRQGWVKSSGILFKTHQTKHGYNQ